MPDQPTHTPPAFNLPAVPESTANGFPLSSRPRSLDWNFTTLDRADPAQRVLATRAADRDGDRLIDLVGKQIEVEHVYLTPAELIDLDTGEITIKVACALITPAGALLCCTSTGVFHSLRAAWQEQGAGPWKDPLVFEVMHKHLGEKNNPLKLRYLGRRSELAAPAKKGGK